MECESCGKDIENLEDEGCEYVYVYCSECHDKLLNKTSSLEWISVKDKLPGDANHCKYECVLILSMNDADAISPIISIGVYRQDHWEILGDQGAHSDTGFYYFESKDVTHWSYIKYPEDK